jgi:L-asparaginase
MIGPMPRHAVPALVLACCLSLAPAAADLAQETAAPPATAGTAPLPRVHVLATGGTIAGSGYAGVEEREALDLIEAVPGLAELARVSSSDPFTLPSSQLTPDDLWRIHQEVEKVLEDPDVAGVVVTQGTDSLEETAFLLDLLHDDPRPVVVTGAMRLPTEEGADGSRNLTDAVRLAATPEARGLGVLVLLNERIHAGRAVRKATSRALDAFASATTGPLGYIDRPDVFLLRRPLDRMPLGPPRLEPRVDLVSLTVGSDGHLVKAAVDAGAQGLVIDAFGRGNLPRGVLEQVIAAHRAGVVVVVTTRTGDGRSVVWPRLAELGIVAGAGLDALEARLLLMAALPLTRDPAVLQSWFDVLSGKAGARALEPSPAAAPAAPAAP